VEFCDLKIGDLIEFEVINFPGKHVGLIMGVFQDPFLLNSIVCEIYLSHNDYVYLAESEIKDWKLLTPKEKQ
tara:strand:- start:217 stop:432 length:216 start_codon:yes stop_codon:yes gene_type:complete